MLKLAFFGIITSVFYTKYLKIKELQWLHEKNTILSVS